MMVNGPGQACKRRKARGPLLSNYLQAAPNKIVTVASYIEATVQGLEATRQALPMNIKGCGWL